MMPVQNTNVTGHAVTSGSEDVRERVLRYAILAPSPRNTQPWKIQFKGIERILVSIDHERLLTACDPKGRQAFLSTGAFLENLDLAARSFGYRADIDLFPEGWPDATAIPDTSIARIDLIPNRSCDEDPLFLQIPVRHTNRRPFRKEEVSLSIAGQITESFDYTRVSFGFSNNRDLIASLTDFSGDAMNIELSDLKRKNETLKYFRFTDQEARESPDGIGFAQSGYGRVSRSFIGHFFLSRDRATSSQSLFLKNAVKKVREQTAGAGGIGWLSTKSDHRIEQIRAGRAFQRIHLKATSLGISLQAITQPLADYPDMRDLRSRLYEHLGTPDTHTIQMLFRLGYAPPVPSSPRRDLDAFLAG
jgi:hypothetical protein